MGRLFKNYPNKITQAYKAGAHNGIDLVGKGDNNISCLDYIVAHSAGTVVEVMKNYATTDSTGNSYGNYVKIQHPNGYYTLYAHMKYGSVAVSPGERVEEGEVIGYMGNTGHSFGAHLHFEVRNPQNVRIDPTPYINAELPAIPQPSVPQENNNTQEVKTVNIELNVLKEGAKGNQVKTLQRLLNTKNNADLDVDGSFGPATLSAVKKYQESYNLDVDGIVGPATWNSLLK